MMEEKNQDRVSCSYWQRQEFRKIDETGFGMSPYELMSQDQLNEFVFRREYEDKEDPPCGICYTCRESVKHTFPEGV